MTKNVLLLVEYAIMARRDFGLNRYDALVDACNKRAHPIMMTTIAMGLGADPGFMPNQNTASPLRHHYRPKAAW